MSITIEDLTTVQHGRVGHGPGWIPYCFDTDRNFDFLWADYTEKCWSDPVHIWRETGMVYIWSGWVRPPPGYYAEAPGVTCDRCHQAKGMYQDTRCSGTKPSGERCTRPFVGVAGFVSDGEDCEDAYPGTASKPSGTA